MLERFKSYIKQYQLIDKSDEIAVAVSGGVDSVVACHLFDKMEQPFQIVHCNFQLRGDESDEDEVFVSDLSKKLKHCTGFHYQRFETNEFVLQTNQSIQMAARELRYAYFQSLYADNCFDKLITAHHQNDSVETFLMNLKRGSGSKGLSGIPLFRDFIIRPMLGFTKADIVEFAEQNAITYRQDSSNESNKYTRNSIRNKLIPIIEEVLPGFGDGVAQSIRNLSNERDLLAALVAEKIELVVDNVGVTEQVKLPINSIMSFPQPVDLLYFVLDSYGFNYQQVASIYAALHDSGAQFYSPNYMLLVDREYIILKVNRQQDVPHLEINSEGIYQFGRYEIHLEKSELTSPSFEGSSEIVSINSNLFPLTLRTWEQEDFIQPFGMKGKKLLSDFFIDEKIDQFSKNEVPLLCKGKEVFWICGHRISEKLRINDSSQNYLMSILG